MAGIKSGLWVALVGMLAGGWFACSTTDQPVQEHEDVGEVRQDLDPGWTPQSLGAVAWYVAADDNNHVVKGTGNSVSKWIDQTINHNDITQDSSQNQPHLNATGWASTQPTLTFD